MHGTVLILGGPDDEHASHMAKLLAEGGTDVELLESRSFPMSLQISFEPQAGVAMLRLPSGRRLDLLNVRSVYWRAYSGVEPAPLPDPEQYYIAENDSRSLFEGLLKWIPARWVNSWNAYQSHQTKPAQLAQVAALGVPIPATLIGNNAESVRDFCVRYPRTIFKPVQGGAHTQRVTKEHLTDRNLANLACAPVTLQEEIPGTNIRAFVASDRVLACEIRSGELDFRDDPDAAIIPCELPAEVVGHCLSAAKALDLLWTAIDLRRTPEGMHFFLEANPSPMFLGFESRSGLPLSNLLANLLLA